MYLYLHAWQDDIIAEMHVTTCDRLTNNRIRFQSFQHSRHSVGPNWPNWVRKSLFDAHRHTYGVVCLYDSGYTGIRMPVRLWLDRHTYACATQVIQAYVRLCDSGKTGIHMPVRLGVYRHTYFNQWVFRKFFWPLIGWSTYAYLTQVAQAYVCLYNPSRTGICMPV